VKDAVPTQLNATSVKQCFIVQLQTGCKQITVNIALVSVWHNPLPGAHLAENTSITKRHVPNVERFFIALTG
jgi:hypothetical protein